MNRCVGEFPRTGLLGRRGTMPGDMGAEVPRRRAGDVAVGRRGLMPGDTGLRYQDVGLEM